MATSDYQLANLPGASFRAELNQILQAIITNNSSSTQPSVTFAYMFWVDTTSNKLKQRNASNNNWINICSLTNGGIEPHQVPNLDATKITTGLLAAARIANLPASKITYGEFSTARIPSLPASKITSGTLSDERIPRSITRDSELATTLSHFALANHTHPVNGIQLSGLQYTSYYPVAGFGGHKQPWHSSGEALKLLPTNALLVRLESVERYSQDDERDVTDYRAVYRTIL